MIHTIWLSFSSSSLSSKFLFPFFNNKSQYFANNSGDFVAILLTVFSFTILLIEYENREEGEKEEQDKEERTTKGMKRKGEKEEGKREGW